MASITIKDPACENCPGCILADYVIIKGTIDTETRALCFDDGVFDENATTEQKESIARCIIYEIMGGRLADNPNRLLRTKYASLSLFPRNCGTHIDFVIKHRPSRA
jgi:hypothetical protein